MSSYLGNGGVSSQWDIDTGFEDDILDQSEYQYAARDHILFCIDASKSMQTPVPDQENDAGLIRGKSPLHQALEAVVKIERTKVITGPADSVGVLLYNVDAPPTETGSIKAGTYVVQALRTISAEEIKRLIKLLEAADDEYAAQGDEDKATTEPEVLKKHFPPIEETHELNIADVLSACTYLFRDAGNRVVGNKRVFLVTDNDEPPGSATNRSPARTVFGDMTAYGVSVNTFFVSRPGHTFDPKTYWNDILSRADSEEDGQAADGLDELTEMICDLVIRQAPKRKQFTVPLKFGGRDGDIEIGVAGYALISEQKKGTSKLVRMRGQAVEEVNIKTQYTAAETGADLAQSEITQAYDFGDESKIENVLEPNWWETAEMIDEQREIAEQLLRIEQAHREAKEEYDGDGKYRDQTDERKFVAKTKVQFTDEQIRSLKTMGIEPPQIKILGFQSPDNLVLADNIKHSYFIYPDETTYTGSTRAFTALLKSCLKFNRHALALCRFRTNSPPEFCVLIPQEEKFNKREGGQEDPPGFHVIILPFVDDIREPPKKITDNLTASDDEVKIMEKLMRRLRFKSGKYVSDVYPNPALQYHQRQLQALAFEEDFDTEAFDDRALPKYAGIHKAAGHLMTDWKKLIDDDERAAETLNPSTKRHVVEVDAEDLQDVAGAYQSGNMDKLKVAELRDYAKFHKINLSGRTKKVDIIDAIKDHLDQTGGAKKAKTDE